MDNKEINKQEETEDKGTRIDRAIQKFADLMIQRLENSKKRNGNKDGQKVRMASVAFRRTSLAELM